MLWSARRDTVLKANLLITPGFFFLPENKSEMDQTLLFRLFCGGSYNHVSPSAPFII